MFEMKNEAQAYKAKNKTALEKGNVQDNQKRKSRNEQDFGM